MAKPCAVFRVGPIRSVQESSRRASGNLPLLVTITCDLRHRNAMKLGGDSEVSCWRWGAAVVAKCSNPSCSAPFRYLKDGKLFRLESNPTLPPSKSDRVEYFWLCHCCSSTMTLRLRQDGTVITVLVPEAVRGVADVIALTPADRGNALWLRTVTSLLPAHFRSLFGTQLKGRHNAAPVGRM
jgi:hypothetical protein